MWHQFDYISLWSYRYLHLTNGNDNISWVPETRGGKYPQSACLRIGIQKMVATVSVSPNMSTCKMPASMEGKAGTQAQPLKVGTTFNFCWGKGTRYSLRIIAKYQLPSYCFPGNFSPNHMTNHLKWVIFCLLIRQLEFLRLNNPLKASQLGWGRIHMTFSLSDAKAFAQTVDFAVCHCLELCPRERLSRWSR